MPAKIHERFHWAVEQMNIQPDAHVLEIGAGHGFAAALICERLTSGHLTAMDRSDKMTAVASKRNAACSDEGKVDFVTGSLEDAEFEAGQFDTIFAFNVNVFWTEPGVGLDKIRRWLKPDGSFYLFYMPPSADYVDYYGDSLNATLVANGFATQPMQSKPMDKSAVLVVVGVKETGRENL
jgi:ubiquinone/menaquinone biosynthesis C-methylase UbiE